MSFLVTNYSVTWIADAGGVVDYKVFHNTNSYVIPTPSSSKTKWRYPYADILMFSYDKEHDHIAYKKNNWRGLYPSAGFNKSLKWPNGTKLVQFGDFKMRLSTENEKFLSKLYPSNYMDVGITHGYDHLRQTYFKRPKVAFEITQTLSSAAMPFRLPSHLRTCSCKPSA